ncbi:MAG TPA: protein phosphatase 2C domain-containing protein [Nitriliruptorales bacterium]
MSTTQAKSTEIVAPGVATDAARSGTSDAVVAVVVPLDVACATHVGYKREHNEDRQLVDEQRRLFAVADGMGGPPAGEVASALTIAALDATVTVDALTGEVECRTLVDAIDRANRDVLDDASEHEDRQGMGSTVVACHVTWDGIAVIAHSGDSRAYLLRHDAVARLTHDHVRVAKRRRLLTRCVGRQRGAAPDVIEVVTEPGDRLLLCSDGLTDMLEDGVITWLLRSAQAAQDAADQLVAAALEAGGRDNVTVIVVDVDHQQNEQHDQQGERHVADA